jgi:deoxyribonuclease-4
MILGAHVSAAGGVELAPERGRKVTADCIQLFSRSPRSLRGAKPVTGEQGVLFRENLRKHRQRAAVIHGNYLINLCAIDRNLLKVSRQALVEEMENAQAMGVRHLIFHPGSHRGKGLGWGIRTIAASLDQAVRKADAPDVLLTLENTAGQGDTVGNTLEVLRDILDAAKARERLAVCLDTCHAFAAGYDFRTDEAYDAFLSKIDETIGLETVRAFHLNDSKTPLGSGRDRHEDTGRGEMGLKPFELLVNDARWKDTPGCLEYPGTDGGFRRNLKVLRALVRRG